jgi:hypothetical protein
MLPLLLVFAAGRLALRLADVAFPDLNFIALVLCVIWTHLSPPGSAAHRWARFGTWVSITLGIPWAVVGPPTFEAVVWGMAAFSVLPSLYLLIFH